MRCVMIMVLILFVSVSFAQDYDKFGERLKEAFSNSEEEYLPVFVMMKERYDSEELYNKAVTLSKKERRAFVINELNSFSNATQSNLLYSLEQKEKDGEIKDLRPLWIANLLRFSASKLALIELNEHQDIDFIEYDPFEYALDGYEPQSVKYIDNPTREITYNVQLMNAPEVWEMGFQGQGVVVAVIDTGVNYNHQDLQNRMWHNPNYPNHGWNFVSNNNNPMDDHGHGSHCAGTVAGDGTAGSETGVAPQASIMALKVLSSSGSGQQQAVNDAVQFAVENGADIGSISLGWLNPGTAIRVAFREVMANALAAGFIISKSAGNRSSQGLTVPADCPPPWLHPDQTEIGGLSAIVSIGATDSNDQLASFSSRGPTSWFSIAPFNDYRLNPGVGLIKPDLCAPGVDVKSLRYNNNSGYTLMSGTSMSTPGVAGVMALMLSRNSELTPEQIHQYLEETALALTPNKSNTHGSGRVDAFAAINAIGYLTLETYEFSDENNNIPEYNETINIAISVANIGINNAANVRAVISCDNEYINILQDTAVFEFIEEGEVSTLNDAFSFETASNTPNLHQIEFSLVLQTEDEQSWSDFMSVEINAPELNVSNALVFDPQPGGNDDGIIDPGEELILFLPIKNIGGAKSADVYYTITTEDINAVIVEGSEANLNQIEVGEILYPSLKVIISEEAEETAQIPFTYYVQSGDYVYEGVFKIFVGGIVTVEIGAGNTVSSENMASPINIYYRSLRGQMVYTAEELIAAGAIPGLPVIEVGFYVSAPPLHPLPNYTVRMKHTTAEDVSSHDDGHFQTVYQTDSYTPNGGGWDMITLTTPFLWNGTDNILLDTAFSQTTSWNSSGQLRIYEVDNGFRFSRSDSANQINAETTNIETTKPQVAFMLGVDPNAVDDRARNLTAHLSAAVVVLSWEEPDLIERNPLGYNIYRNGIRLNEELIEQLEYLDSDYDSTILCYYYITAVYTDKESAPSNIAEIEFIVAEPNIEPEPGNYSEPIIVALQCPTPEAEIYYTLDDTEPTTESLVYTHPFTLETHTILRAKAFKTDWIASVELSCNYYFHYAPSNLIAESFINIVHLEWDNPYQPEQRAHTRLKYSSRGTQSREFIGYNIYRSFNEEEDFIQINDNLIIANEYEDEELTAGNYAYYITAQYESGESIPTEVVFVTVMDKTASPYFSHEPGEYEEAIELLLFCDTEDAVIYYTIDESEPDSLSLFFAGEPILLDNPVTVKAIAVKSGFYDSDVVEAFYNIQISDVEDETAELFATALMNAYPNPFNPVTNIAFTLREESRVTIDIFNIKGNRLRILTDGIYPQGQHTVEWNGFDKNNRPVGSGIYFYRMSTDNGFNEIKKVLLLK